MPHLVLEYTKNVKFKTNFTDLFTALHKTLKNAANMNMEDCKSRAVKLENYSVSDSKNQSEFAHLSVSILEGRSPDLKQLIGETLLDKLKDAVQTDSQIVDLQITIEIKEMVKSQYFKYTVSK